MKNQIFKAIKGLKVFTIEDVKLITDCEESEILKVINDFEIQEINGVFHFEKQKNDLPTRKSKTGKNILMKNFSQKYLDILKCSQKTIDTYQTYLRLHIVPLLGNKRIIDITTHDIVTFQQIKLKENQSNKSINNYVTLLFGIFEYALKEELIIKNPCWIVDKLEIKKKIKKINKEKLAPFFNTAKEKDFGFYVLISVAYETGIPRGQLLDLKWSDLDFINYKIKDIKIPNELIEDLIFWKKICIKNEYNLVFSNTVGKKWNPENIMNRKFKPLAKKVGVDGLRFIDLTNQKKL